MIREYPKTENVFTRNPDTHKLNLWDFRMPEFNQIKSWLVTEKIDGTNIRISLVRCEHEEPLGDLVEVCKNATKECTDGREDCLHCDAWLVKINGRTANSQFHAGLYQYLTETFTLEKMLSVCEGDEPYEFTLYGEGYGEGIQKGGYYRKGVSFRLFDVLVGDKWWLDRYNMVDVAAKLNINVVPIFGTYSMPEIIEIFSSDGFDSVVALEENNTEIEAEGVVCRTDPYLFNKYGERIKFKLKAKDLN
jgi:hypothetical protein